MCVNEYWSSSFSETARLACPDKSYIAGFLSSQPRVGEQDSFSPYHIHGAECCNETSLEYADQNTHCVETMPDIG